MADNSLPNVWVVRADGGKYTEVCVKGGYTGIGWDLGDLAGVVDREQLRPIYAQADPDETSNYVIGQQVGQIARFLWEIKPGDHVITPTEDSAWLRHGRVPDDASSFYSPIREPGPYRYRRYVEWDEQRLNRGEFSVPFQRTLSSSLTVFNVSRREEFLEAIGVIEAPLRADVGEHDPYEVTLSQILELTPEEFEHLVRYVLAAMGFEDTEVIGKPGDKGVDVKGTLNVSGLARVDVFVQAKRYKLDSRVKPGDVRKLRQVVPSGEQGAVITTASFERKAYDAASESGFPRIGLINGSQLVDLLVEHWADIPEDFRELLGLKPGLVLV